MSIDEHLAVLSDHIPPANMSTSLPDDDQNMSPPLPADARDGQQLLRGLLLGSR